MKIVVSLIKQPQICKNLIIFITIIFFCHFYNHFNAKDNKSPKYILSVNYLKIRII